MEGGSGEGGNLDVIWQNETPQTWGAFRVARDGKGCWPTGLEAQLPVPPSWSALWHRTTYSSSQFPQMSNEEADLVTSDNLKPTDPTDQWSSGGTGMLGCPLPP